jgi:hypothetical protein
VFSAAYCAFPGEKTWPGKLCFNSVHARELVDEGAGDTVCAFAAERIENGSRKESIKPAIV